jgi:hypothetical protein
MLPHTHTHTHTHTETKSSSCSVDVFRNVKYVFPLFMCEQSVVVLYQHTRSAVRRYGCSSAVHCPARSALPHICHSTRCTSAGSENTYCDTAFSRNTRHTDKCSSASLCVSLSPIGCLAHTPSYHWSGEGSIMPNSLPCLRPTAGERLTVRPGDGGNRHFCRQTFTRLQGATTQKTVIRILCAVRSCNATKTKVFFFCLSREHCCVLLNVPFKTWPKLEYCS